MIFDSHVHTEFSEDSQMKIEDAIAKSKERNIGIILTEHMDLDQPIGIGFRYDINKYFKDYGKYRGNNVLLGTELGLAMTTIEENTEIAANNPYDYVLGSIHSVYKDDIFSSYGTLDISKKEKFYNYFNCMLDCVKACDYFDSLGHIDYISRYVPYENKEIIFKDHQEQIEQIFKTILNKGKVIELNAARLGMENAQQTLLTIYKFYKELGGQYVTLGSDAHTPKDLFRNFDVAFKLLEEVGLKPIYFKERKPELFR